MALTKTPISLNFAKGLDTKTDPYQIPIGSFPVMQNSVFSTTGRLTKRNGYSNLTNLPNKEQTTITTLNDNLIVTGSNLYSYNQEGNSWIDKGTIQPVQLSVQSLVKSGTSQESPDAAISAEGLVCLAYNDSGSAYYQISDARTGEQLVNRQALGGDANNPKVFVLNKYFIVTYMKTITATPTLQYVAIPIAMPTAPKVAATISANVASIDVGYDAYVFASNMYVSWGGGDGAVKIAYVSQNLVNSSTISIPAAVGDEISVTADLITNYIWTSYVDNATDNAFSAAFNLTLAPIVAPTAIAVAVPIAEITSVAINGVLTVYYQNVNNYSYMDDDGDDIRTDYVSKLTVVPPVSGTGAGTASAPTIILRSVGLASKAFFTSFTYTLKTDPLTQVTTQLLPSVASISSYLSSAQALMVAYGDMEQVNDLDNSNQPTYFLINSSGQILMKLAYANGGGYARTQSLPNVSMLDDVYAIPYMFADFLTTVNKTTNPPAGTPSNAIYTQYGINLSLFTLNLTGQQSSEIAGALHLTGGQLWEYDTVRPVEHGFHVWPENIVATTSGSGGLITAQLYYYVFTYEWTDNAGNLQRSAPSIPLPVTTTGSTSTNTIEVPTLRLTYKMSPNPVRIVGYRWSVAQQIYYQFTSVTSPHQNDTTIDSIEIVDMQADSAILGNAILYTTGGVIENIGAPPSIDSALFDNRLFLIDAEDQNLLWYSKQVIQSTPVEMSDLLTIYVAPTTGAQGSTGPMRCLFPMDDKIIILKQNALYYINGSGPDNTGANSTYSQPIFITGAVGSSNPNSLALIPQGLMFQSDKGIWLLGRDLSTKYIGAPVEQYNAQTVLSSETIPETNQVRFILDNNITLMYDYFYDQWGTHTNTAAISATIYQSAHTYLNSFGQVLQETPGMFKDGAEPVLMSITTAWINIAGIQGFERFYFANLLGTYYTPFKLNFQMAYNYNPSPTQNVIVTPNNFAPSWGDEALWGSGGNWGGSDGNVFTARVFPEVQKCQSFQVSIQEVYDPSLGVDAGQGLTLSGLNLITGMKRGFRTQSAAKSFGSNS